MRSDRTTPCRTRCCAPLLRVKTLKPGILRTISKKIQVQQNLATTLCAATRHPTSDRAVACRRAVPPKGNGPSTPCVHPHAADTVLSLDSAVPKPRRRRERPKPTPTPCRAPRCVPLLRVKPLISGIFHAFAEKLECNHAAQHPVVRTVGPRHGDKAWAPPPHSLSFTFGCTSLLRRNPLKNLRFRTIRGKFRTQRPPQLPRAQRLFSGGPPPPVLNSRR